MGHRWITVDEWNADGSKVVGKIELHFSPSGYTVHRRALDADPVFYPENFFTEVETYKSNSKQDRALVELWEQLDRDRKAGKIPNWNPVNNCWVPVQLFYDYGGSHGLAKPQ
jgi:hypothetical protein